jgi:hypothetical protein
MTTAGSVVGERGPRPGPGAVPQQWPSDRSFHEELGRWRVAWIKTRHEKTFADELRDLGFPYYLPMMERTHRRPDNGRPRKAWVPLFPSYVAFAGSGPITPLYQTGRLHRILPVPDQERFVADLEAVRRVLASRRPVAVHPGLRPGVVVRIVRGAFQGLTGPIERHDGGWRFWVNVEMFNRSLSVQLPAEALQGP